MGGTRLCYALASLCAFSGAACAAQNGNKESLGTVVGHVYCADTNAPARLARVMLEPVREVDEFQPPKAGQPRQHGSTVSFIETNLDGSFAMQKMKPGTYYVIAEKDGYVSPMAQFTRSDLERPTREVKLRMAKLLPKVSVEGNQSTSVEVRLERGAAISGNVSFDDGSPASGLTVKVLRKEKDGKWAVVETSAMSPFKTGANTDDQGHYRIAGLLSGEYTAQTDLTLNETLVSGFLGSAFSSMVKTHFSLPVFSGGGVRPATAVPFKVGAGEERTGEDIVIPLAKLHGVTGTIMAGRDGHIVNGGTVALLYADDKSEMASVNVNADDSTFHFEFVPEGEYIVQVKSAGDVVREEIPNPPNTMPPTDTRVRILHSYGGSEQPLSVHGEINSVVLSVPEQSAKGSARPASGGTP